MKLLSEHEDVLAEFSSGQVAVPPDSDDGWIQVSLEAPGGRGGAWERRAGLMETPPMARVARVRRTWRRGVGEGPWLRHPEWGRARGWESALGWGGWGRRQGPNRTLLPPPPRSPTPSPTMGQVSALSASNMGVRTPSTGRAGSGPE